MKKIYKSRKGEKLSVPQHGYFRRLVRHMFLAWTKHQACSHQIEFPTILGKLQSIEDSVEVIAREMRRQEKRKA